MFYRSSIKELIFSFRNFTKNFHSENISLGILLKRLVQEFHNTKRFSPGIWEIFR